MKLVRGINTVNGGISGGISGGMDHACCRALLLVITSSGALGFLPGAIGQVSGGTPAADPGNFAGADGQSALLRGLKNGLPQPQATPSTLAPVPSTIQSPDPGSTPEMAPSSLSSPSPPSSPASPTSASNGLLDPAKPVAKPLSAIVGRDVDVRLVPGHTPSRRMKALHVTVHNRSDEPLVFEGDKSLICSRDTGSLEARCLSQVDLDAVDRPAVTFKGKVASDVVASATAAVSVGVVQTVDTIRREYGPINKRYEYDQARRENEESRFGRRLLYPGDRSDGNIYFPAEATMHGKMLTIPVKSFYDGSTQSSISVLIEVPD